MELLELSNHEDIITHTDLHHLGARAGSAELGENKCHIRAKSALDVLKIYLTLGYYICLFPFRFKTGNRRLHRNSVQMVLCSCLHVLAFVFALAKWRLRDGIDLPTVEISHYLRFAIAVSEIAILIAFSWLLWTQQATFEYIGKHFPAERDPLVIQDLSNSKRKHIFQRLLDWNVISVFLILILISLSLKLHSEEYVSQPTDCWFGPGGYIENAAKFLLFIPKEWELNTPTQIIISTVYLLAGVTYAIMAHLGVAFYCILGLMLRDIGCYFVGKLNSNDTDPNITAAKVVELYDKIRKFVNNLNVGLGPFMLVLLLTLLPYYLVRIPIIFHKNPWLEKISASIYIINYTLFLILSSSFTRQMRHIKTWLLENENSITIPSHKLQLIILEIQDDPLGLSACGFFQISYSFIAALLHLIIIYGFVTLQNMEDMDTNRQPSVRRMN